MSVEDLGVLSSEELAAEYRRISADMDQLRAEYGEAMKERRARSVEVLRALYAREGTYDKAAKVLGISRGHFSNKLHGH